MTDDRSERVEPHIDYEIEQAMRSERVEPTDYLKGRDAARQPAERSDEWWAGYNACRDAVANETIAAAARQPAEPEYLTCAGCDQYIAGDYWHKGCAAE